jgi:phosphonate transport system permease protein
VNHAVPSPGSPLEIPAAQPSALQVFRLHHAALVRRRRITAALGLTIFLTCVLLASHVGQFSPARLAEGFPRLFEYIEKILPILTLQNFRGDMAHWFYGLPEWLALLGETVLMAYTGTLLGTLGALALCFVAAHNLRPNATAAILARRLLEVARTIPDLIYALIFVFAFGLGPLAGILALAIHSMGASGKLFAEASENIDMKPVDGIRSVGGSWLQCMRYGVFPQVLPNFVSYTLWRFEINVRTAAVMGFVGAGGIGQELITAIRMLYYEDISALLILIIATVALIDLACERLRHVFIGKENLQ